MATAVTAHVGTLAARGAAYALLARLLGPDTTALADPETMDALRESLRRSGDERALARLDPADAPHGPSVEELSLRWVRWFDQGRIPPYECSNTPPSAGGHTARLADVAGFYRAFGMAVRGDRPDHVVAELEFASAVTLAEADARSRGDEAAAEICNDAARAFLRDHLGGWLDAWAARIGSTDALEPWAAVAAAAAELVAADAAQREVVPIRSYPVLPADASLLPPDEPLPICGDDSESLLADPAS